MDFENPKLRDGGSSGYDVRQGIHGAEGDLRRGGDSGSTPASLARTPSNSLRSNNSNFLEPFNGVFVGLYGTYVAYQERCLRRGMTYVIAMVAEFDEYMNDFLYLRDGTILPKTQLRRLTHKFMVQQLDEAINEWG